MLEPTADYAGAIVVMPTPEIVLTAIRWIADHYDEIPMVDYEEGKCIVCGRMTANHYREYEDGPGPPVDVRFEHAADCWVPGVVEYAKVVKEKAPGQSTNPFANNPTESGFDRLRNL